MSAIQSGVQPVGIQDPNARTITWTLVLARTYGLYARHFWKYFRIALVPAIVAYAFIYFARLTTRELLPDFPFGGRLILAIGLVWIKGAVYWTISAFFFAAIAATFAKKESASLPAVADAYTLPRRRIGALAATAVLTWTLWDVGRNVSGLAVVQLLNHFHVQNYWMATAAWSLVLLLLGGLLSRFILVIPGLIQSPASSFRSALKQSVKQTEGWEVFSMMFLAKSAAIGYGIYWIAGRGLDWLWYHWTLNPNGFPWVERSVYIFIAAVVETPLFIAFCVLDEELRTTPEEAQSRAANALEEY